MNLRVRYNAQQEPEISVDDLRASGNRDLQDLAEADRKKSTRLTAKGDNNGWLSLAEVERSGGLHGLVVAGFAELVAEAKRGRAQSLPSAQVQALMALPLEREQAEIKRLKKAKFKERAFEAKGSGLIPELLRLKDFAKVSPALIAKSSIHKLATSIVARVGLGMKVPSSALPDGEVTSLREVSFDTTKPGLIQLYFPLSRAKAIAKEGILNLHEAPDVQGRESRSEWRGHIETELSRLVFPTDAKSSAKLLRLRPKSAILEIDWPPGFNYRHTGGDRFGEAVAVLKTSVYARSTFTPCDSGAVLHADDERNRYMVRPLRDGRAFVSGDYGEYLEAQVWGEITPKDVAEYWVPKGSDPEAVAALAATGAEVYEVKISTEDERYRRTRGARLA